MERLVYSATPEPLVSRRVVPRRVPAPSASAATTAMPSRSSTFSTRTCGCRANATPASAEDDGWVTTMSRARPAAALAVNVTARSRAASITRAVARWVPVAWARVQRTVARPSDPVVVVSGMSSPSPVAENSTVAPSTAWSAALVARTTSGSARSPPAAPDWKSPLSMVSAAGAPVSGKTRSPPPQPKAARAAVHPTRTRLVIIAY